MSVSFVAAVLAVGCSSAPGADGVGEQVGTDEAASTRCPVGTHPENCEKNGTQIYCDCVPNNDPPPPPPACQITGWGTTPQGREVLVQFSTTDSVVTTVTVGSHSLSEANIGPRRYHQFYFAGLPGGPIDYSIAGCGAFRYSHNELNIPGPGGCGSEGQVTCDGRCEKGLGTHTPFLSPTLCYVPDKEPTSGSSHCFFNAECNPHYACTGGQGPCVPCGGHGERDCVRWNEVTGVPVINVGACRPGIAHNGNYCWSEQVL